MPPASNGGGPDNRGAANHRERAGGRVTRFLLAVTRVWLPSVIAAAGVIAVVIGHGRSNSPWAAAGISLIIVALTVWLINWLFRMGVQSSGDREREERAREYFERHGRWPDE